MSVLHKRQSTNQEFQIKRIQLGFDLFLFQYFYTRNQKINSDAQQIEDVGLGGLTPQVTLLLYNWDLRFMENGVVVIQ